MSVVKDYSLSGDSHGVNENLLHVHYEESEEDRFESSANLLVPRPFVYCSDIRREVQSEILGGVGCLKL